MAKRGAKLGTSVLDLDVDDSKFNAGLAKNEQKARAWTDNLGRDVKKGIAQGLGIGGGLLVAQGVAMAIGGIKDVVAGAINAAIEWESAFAGVRKTVDASEEEFADLERAIRDMALEIPIGTTELAGLAEAAGALGVAKKDIAEFTRVTALIGTTTDVSSDQAATSLGQLSNVLGLTSADYERFGSTLVDLGNKGASTESQILEIAARAGAGSKLIGMASHETLAWASAVANLGIEVEAGGSSLQKFFLETAKAVSEGGDKLDTYARLAGTTAAEFTRAWGEDASDALQMFLAGLGELTQGDQLKALEDLDFDDVRITRTLLGLANNADMVGESLDVASEAWEENAALATEAGRRFSTTESKLAVLGNRVNELAITFGENLLPALVDIATFGVEQIEFFVRDVVSLVDSVADTSRGIDMYFGQMGKTVEDWANESGRDVGEAKDAVLEYMNTTGASLEEAIAAVELYGTGNAAALEAQGAAWEAYQAQIAGAVHGATAAVEGGVDPLTTAMDDIEQGITAEAQEARDNAIQAMSDMLGGMTSLFETDVALQEAWQALIDRMDDPYTEAERKADVFSQNTIDNIHSAIVSGDPAITADTYTLVNNMLAQIALMEPGALEGGEAVPPAIREGMDAEMQALIDYIEREVTGESLAAMTLDEAEDLGLSGIWAYAQGMRQNEKEAGDAAAAASLAAFMALERQGWEAGGEAIISTWIGGMEKGYQNKKGVIWGIVDGVKKSLGGSLPEEGPLKGDTAARGGLSIGESWVGSLVTAIDSGLAAIESSVGTVGGALTISPMGMPALSGAVGFDAVLHGGSLGDVQSRAETGGRTFAPTLNVTVNGGDPAETEFVVRRVLRDEAIRWDLQG